MNIMKRTIYFLTFFLLATSLIFSFYSPNIKKGKVLGSQDMRIREISINGQYFSVFVAKNKEERKLGLSNWENLKYNQGMLFVFEEPKMQFFWMKDMNFPLDIIWLKNNKVIFCEKNVAVKDYAGNVNRVYSPEPANQVLEINAGLCDIYNIKKGDKLDIKF
jgi:uncharacterized membrane protein (UPF0127 family)